MQAPGRTTPSRVLIIGLDGATFDLIEPYTRKGHLPTIARLMREGAWSELEVELPPGTVPNWPSFATGKNPGKHGLIWWLLRDSDSGALSVINSNALHGETLWDIASQAGLRVGVINVPSTYPPQPVNGVMITGLLTPPSAQEYTYPPGLREKLEKDVGAYRVFPREPNVRGNEASYLQDLHDTLELRGRAASYLMQSEPWDLFVVVLSATDWVQHAFWKHQDPTHPRHDPTEAQRFGDAILSIYQHCDQVVASLLDLVGDDTSIILMSDHGAGPGVGKAMINNWLLELGFLRLKRRRLTWLKHRLFRLGFTMENVYPWAARLGLMRYKRQLDPRKSRSGGLLRRIFLSYDDVDWLRTQAYTFGGMGQVYVNTKSRGALGCVEDGEEYEQVCRSLIERLSEIRLPGSEAPFVQRAYRREELYHGPHTKDFPDIILLPTDMRYSDSGVEFFSNHPFSELDANSGSHRARGIFVISGSHVKSGEQLRQVHIRDVMPTALHLLGQPVPDDVDGRVVAEALDADWLSAHPVRMRPAVKSDASPAGMSWTGDEEGEVRQRLAGLGYLDG